jgi:effector-binding domain-containing protein
MKFETVDTKSQPMLYVTRSTSMEPQEIAGVTGEAFGAIGEFIGQAGVTPAGPPIAVYRDWDGGKMKVDIGFPVASAEIAKAQGEVQAGHTPSGKTIKAVHRGPYAMLRETYGAMENYMSKAGYAMPALAWEVYVNDPETTQEADLVTEIYMPVV